MLRKLCFSALFFLFACVSSEDNAQQTDVFGDWTLVQMDGVSAQDAELYQQFTLTVGKDKLSGKAFNNFSVKADIAENGDMKVGRNMVTTRLLPSKRGRPLEARYFQSLTTANHWQTHNGQLVLSTTLGKLVFDYKSNP